eukprot:4610517-Alexandrium_andersonii.AAC.1
MPFLGQPTREPRGPAEALGAARETGVDVPSVSVLSFACTERASAPSVADDMAGRTGGDAGQPVPTAMALCRSAGQPA